MNKAISDFDINSPDGEFEGITYTIPSDFESSSDEAWYCAVYQQAMKQAEKDIKEGYREDSYPDKLVFNVLKSVGMVDVCPWLLVAPRTSKEPVANALHSGAFFDERTITINTCFFPDEDRGFVFVFGDELFTITHLPAEPNQAQLEELKQVHRMLARRNAKHDLEAPRQVEKLWLSRLNSERKLLREALSTERSVNQKTENRIIVLQKELIDTRLSFHRLQAEIGPLPPPDGNDEWTVLSVCDYFLGQLSPKTVTRAFNRYMEEGRRGEPKRLNSRNAQDREKMHRIIKYLRTKTHKGKRGQI